MFQNQKPALFFSVIAEAVGTKIETPVMVILIGGGLEIETPVMVIPIGEGLDIFFFVFLLLHFLFSCRRDIIKKEQKRMYFVFPDQPGQWAGPASYNQTLKLVGELVGGGEGSS